MSTIKNTIRKIIPKQAMRQTEEIYRLQKAKLAVAVNHSPAKEMHVVAVTGTNGKTTTCAIINEILKTKYKTALYTTAYTEVDGKIEPNTSHMTVESTWAVQKFFKSAKDTGAEWVVLEVTSHALSQYRIYGVPVDVAVITNLTQDHLDYHGTMDKYALAKSRLLTDFKPKFTVLNADDEWFDFFFSKAGGDIQTVGKKKANYRIQDLKLGSKGSEFSLVSNLGDLEIKSHLVGDFNAYNVAEAAVAGRCAGLNKLEILEGIKNIREVPGRLQSIDEGQDFSVLVDYAHTPDAIEQVLKSVKAITKGEVRFVFGATGNRDKTKRPIMGEIASKYADKIYLTDDETYDEESLVIRDAVRAGIEKADAMDKLTEIGDRAEAIEQAIRDSSKGDAVILAGIGHQDYRAMGGKKIAWDEREVARGILKQVLAESK